MALASCSAPRTKGNKSQGELAALLSNTSITELVEVSFVFITTALWVARVAQRCRRARVRMPAPDGDSYENDDRSELEGSVMGRGEGCVYDPGSKLLKRK